MYVVIRSYSGQGGSALFDALAERENEVKNVISTASGFISYAAFRNDGGATAAHQNQRRSVLAPRTASAPRRRVKPRRCAGLFVSLDRSGCLA